MNNITCYMVIILCIEIPLAIGICHIVNYIITIMCFIYLLR